MNMSNEAETPTGEVELTDEQRNELTSAIANDIYRRATFAQAIQLIQTQCTNQAVDIVKNASKEEILGFLEQLNTSKEAAAASPVDSEENTEK